MYPSFVAHAFLMESKVSVTTTATVAAIINLPRTPYGTLVSAILPFSFRIRSPMTQMSYIYILAFG